MPSGEKTPRIPIVKRLQQRLTETPSGCWEWQGFRTKTGYGRIALPGGDRMAATHRVAWEVAHGPIPPGLNVLHSCDNPPCCNPDHLWLGTPADNVADMIAKGRQCRPMPVSHCAAGHEYTVENTAQYPTGRRCRTCQRERARKRRSTLSG